MTLHDTKTAARHSALNGSLIQRDGGDSIAGICAGSFEAPGLKESHNSLLLIDDNIADVRAFRCALESVRLSVQLTVNFADDIESTVAGPYQWNSAVAELDLAWSRNEWRPQLRNSSYFEAAPEDAKHTGDGLDPHGKRV